MTSGPCRGLPSLRKTLRAGIQTSGSSRGARCGRAADKSTSCAPVSLERGVVKYAEGSCLVTFGHTKVLVTASLEQGRAVLPQGQGAGLGHRRIRHAAALDPHPFAPRSRPRQAVGPHGQEIQRLIGRSMRAVIDLKALGERQITLDCDVLQADGGTRTASITGAWVA